MHTILKKLIRFVILWSVFFLPKEKKIAIERWVRGHDQFRTLCKADCVIVSFGKSGRTWLRVMLSRFYQVKHGLSQRYLIGFDNFHRKNRQVPKLFFTHDNYLKDYTKNADTKVDYYGKKVVLLIRHPADVAVSQYFQWRYRMKPKKKALNKYPLHGEDVSMFEFVAHRYAGLPKLIEFMNAWAQEIPNMKDLLIVRYEDMRAQPEQSLSQILAFMGTPGSAEQVHEAVTFASFENMKKMEEQKTFWLSGGRMVPKDRSNPDSYKVRRAKVGGYRDYFSDAEVVEINALISSQLSPVFDYAASTEPLHKATA